MIYSKAEILTNSASPRAACAVSSQTLLAEFAHRHFNSPHAYFVVEDPLGRPVGVVGVEDIRRRLSSPSFLERRRWQNMPVEAVLNGRLGAVSRNSGTQQQAAAGVPRECTTISQDGSLVAMVTADDIFVSWRSIEQMIRQAQCDHVTNLPVRAAFDANLRLECSRAQRDNHSVAVILIDVDRFKEINDQYGHAAGDAVLGAVGRNLRSTFRSYDMVARYGGDEFAVLCCGCQPGEIDATIKRLRTGMEKLQADVSLPCPIPTLSIGACVAHDIEQVESPDKIIEAADECLYFAKREGRNRSFSTEIGVESDVLC